MVSECRLLNLMVNNINQFSAGNDVYLVYHLVQEMAITV